jgi:hypothetical protein
LGTFETVLALVLIIWIYIYIYDEKTTTHRFEKMVNNPKAIVHMNDEDDVVFVDDKQLEQTWKECNIFL